MKFEDLMTIYEYIREDADQIEERLVSVKEEINELEDKIRKTENNAEANLLESSRAEAESRRRILWREHDKLLRMLDKIENAEVS